MAKLYFDIGANYEEAEHLAKTIEDLKEKITQFQNSASPEQMQAWCAELVAAQQRLAKITTEAAKTGAAIEEMYKDIDPSIIKEAFEEVGADIASTKGFEKGIRKLAKSYEKEIEKTQKKIQQLGKDAQKAYSKGDESTYEAKSDQLIQEIEHLKEVKKARESAGEALDILSGKEEKETGIIEDLCGGTSNFNNLLVKLPSGVGNVLAKVNALTKGMKAFLAVPVVAVVTAIVAAFSAFKTWLSKTEEGEMLMARATGYLKGVLIPLENLAIKIGKALYDAFNSPQKAVESLNTSVKNLWETLKNGALDRWKSIKGEAMAIFNFVSDLTKGEGFRKAFDNLKSALKELPSYKNIEKLVDKGKDVVEGMHESGNQMADIEADRLALSKRESSWQVTKANNKIKKDELQEIFQNTMLNSEWRQRALDAYMKIIEEEKKGDLGIAGAKISLLNREQSLGLGSTSADMAQMNSLRADYADIEANFEGQMKSLMKTRNNILRKGLQEEKALKDAAAETDAQGIQNLEDGIEKDLQLLMIDFQNSLDQISQMEEQFRNANGAALTEDEKKTLREQYPEKTEEEMEEMFGNLTEEQVAILDGMLKMALQTLKKGRADLGEAVYKQFKSQDDKRKDLEKEYLDDMARLETAYTETGDEKFKRSMDVRTAAYHNALDEMTRDSDRMLRLIFSNIDLMSKGTLDTAITGAKAKLQELLKDPTTNASDIEAYRDRLDKLESARSNYDFKGWGGSLIDVMKIRDRKSRIETQKTLDTEARNKITDTGSDAYKRLSVDIELADNALSKLTEDEKKAVAAFAAGQLGDTLSKIGSALREIGEATGDDKLTAMSEGFEEIGGAISNIANGFATGGIWGGIAAAVGTVTDAVINAVASVKIADAKFDQFTKDFQARLDMLKYEVKDYSTIFGIDSALTAKDAYAKAQEALARFTEVSAKLRDMTFKTQDYSWWANAFGKKDQTASLSSFDIWGEDGLLDEKKAQAFLDIWGENLSDAQRQAIQEAIELKGVYDELKESVKDYVGSLMDGTTATIADEMIDGFLRTNSAIVDMTDNLNDFKRKLAESIVQSMLLQKVFTPEKQQQITDMLMSDDVSGAIEAYNNLLNEANDMSGEIEQFLMGINLTEDVSRQSATAGAFQTMSQDAATELNGRFTALQISGENIESLMETITMDFEAFSARYATQFIAVDDIRNIQAQALIELQGINENTLAALKPIRTMNDTIEEIRKHIEKL